MRLLICLAAAILLSPNSFGQQALTKKAQAQKREKPATWEKEPDTFMGIKFGESFAAQVPECSKGQYGYKRDDKDRCFRVRVPARGNQEAILEIHNSPSIGLAIFQLNPLLVEGNFEGMYFGYNHSDYVKMLELFRARYGEPTKKDLESYQTRGGAGLDGVVYIWQGRNVTITVKEYGDRLDEGVVYVVTKKRDESQDADSAKNAARNKDKL